MITDTEDTITAIATPAGRAALGIVRISGRNCADLIAQLFIPRRESIVPFRPILGRVKVDETQYIDEAVLTYFQKPHSYTREDLAEISCHGNPLILEKVLTKAISCGARLARPGEFTYRAFLNGRIDLVQAEAVRDLIAADSIYQAELALQQLDGRLSARFELLRTKFIELIALMEGNIDFSEEQHYNFIDSPESLRRLENLIREVREILGTFERGKIIREGFHVAIVGKPNVGKSSLFNALLGKNRAIVTAIPGTTRDYLQERLTIGNHLIHLMDTAGIRESNEVVEQEGIRRSLQVIENAQLICFVLDGTQPISAEDLELWQLTSPKDRIVVCNKSDASGFRNQKIDGIHAVAISAAMETGLDSLILAIRQRADTQARFSNSDSLISSVRHRDILRQCFNALERARGALMDGASEEFPLIDLQEALRYIGEITGEVTIEDIYQHIFSNFCIGK